jgi:hypothetical protein
MLVQGFGEKDSAIETTADENGEWLRNVGGRRVAGHQAHCRIGDQRSAIDAVCGDGFEVVCSLAVSSESGARIGARAQPS